MKIQKNILFSLYQLKKCLINDNNNDNDKKNGKGKKAKTTTYSLRFIDSCRFMQDSLSNLADNLSGINRKISHAALIENFYNTYQLSNKDLNKFALISRKGVYP